MDLFEIDDGQNKIAVAPSAICAVGRIGPNAQCTITLFNGAQGFNSKHSYEDTLEAIRGDFKSVSEMLRARSGIKGVT